MKRKLHFQTKLTIAFFLLSLSISWSTIYFINNRALLAQKEELRKKLVAIASTGAIMIDAEKLLSIPLLIEGEKTSQYQEIKYKLNEILKANPEIRFVYTMVKTDKPDIWKFVVDAEKNPKIVSRCGEEYSVSKRAQMQLAFEGPIADKKLEADRWGSWLSGYSPIRDAVGNAVAIIGVDYSAEDFTQLQSFIKERTYTLFAVSIIMSILLGYVMARSITMPLNKLVEAMKKVAVGDFTQSINIRTNDEIEDASKIFNHMTKELSHLYKNLQDHFLSTIFSLVTAIEAKDSYTKGHSERVSKLSAKIGEQMGLLAEDVQILRNIGILHDIGKIGIAETILCKPDKLSVAEMDLIKAHPVIGESILKSIEMLRPGLSIVKSHHERPDGTGYPEGLKGKEIPTLAAIVAVADSYDAMISARPYRKAMSQDVAIAEIKKNIGKQFVPEIVQAFLKIIEKESRQKS